jgi:hypothetical protein
MAALACLVSGVALADSLSVTSTAAMGGVADQTCTGDGMPGPCGLEVFHDNSSVAFVEDQSPQNETVYRASFLFNPNNISPGAKLRQNIFRAIGPNPNPGVGSCDLAGLKNVGRVFLLLYRPDGSRYAAFLQGIGNQCGERATLRVELEPDTPKRICVEMEFGNALSGRLAIAAVDIGDPCPTSGSGAWQERDLSNGLTNVDRVRLGTPGTNNFGAGESGDMYFDEFESFRTLAP